MAVPNNTGRKKAKPTEKKSFSLDDFKKATGTETVEEKPLEWYRISKAMQEATGLPGFPRGYVSLARGFSNSGKSTSAAEAAVAAQKMGDLPIIIDTENNLGVDRFKKMGLDVDGLVIFINNTYLLNNFGKKKNKDITEASIEDLADCINYFLDKQEADELPHNLCFIIDSIGVLDCERTIKAKEAESSDNNMWNAGAYEKAFKAINNYRIPNSRKVNKPYTNTLIGVQKIWLDNMGSGVVKHKGGEAFWYASRLIYHHGGVVSSGVKKVDAVSKTKKVQFGTEAKVRVEKNQIDGIYGGINMEGKLISTPHGFIGVEKADIEAYKKEHIQHFRDILGGDINPEDFDLSVEKEYDIDPSTGNLVEVDEE